MIKSTMDYLIVGGGIAGTVMALQLIERGRTVTMYDKPAVMTASRIAAGIINPVTGQRFVKSWMFDELSAAANKFYKSYDALWGTTYFKDTKIQRALFSKNEVSNYELRSADEHYNQHFSTESIAKEKAHFYTVDDWCTIRGAKLSIAEFIKQAKSFLVTKGMILENDKIDYSQCVFNENSIEYQGNIYGKLICCEGISITKNPFFKYLPMVPAKGECLIIEVPTIKTKDIYKHKIFFAPIEKENQYWAGANYDWDFTSADPSPLGKDWLVNKLNDSLKVPYTIKEHLAAIRPTGKDRRPYLGVHPEHSCLYVFNALGTKGSSLAPYWASQLIEFIEDKSRLDKEVDIRRFE